MLAYERASRIAYKNKLKTDSAALDARLAKARKARDQGEDGEVVRFLDLTVPLATSVRAVKSAEGNPRVSRERLVVSRQGRDARWQALAAARPACVVLPDAAGHRARHWRWAKFAGA